MVGDAGTDDDLGPTLDDGAAPGVCGDVIHPGEKAPAYGLIRTGEASGTLPRMLLRYCEGETAAIDRFDDLVAEWIPRLADASAALLVAYAILHGGAFMPSLPQELR